MSILQWKDLVFPKLVRFEPDPVNRAHCACQVHVHNPASETGGFQPLNVDSPGQYFCARNMCKSFLEIAGFRFQPSASAPNSYVEAPKYLFRLSPILHVNRDLSI